MKKQINKKILITGGAGFLGSNLAEFLINKNEFKEIILIDFKESEKIKFLKHIGRAKINFYKINLLNESDLRKLSKYFTDAIYLVHLASRVPKGSMKESDTLEDLKVNIVDNLSMFFNLIKFLKPIEFIVFASSASIYGNNINLPIKENEPVNPFNFYALSKYVIEEVLKKLFYEKGIESTSLRFSQIYGPGEPHKLAITKFIDAIKKGEKIKIFNGGKDIRNLIYIDDAVKAIDLALKAKKNGIYNISYSRGFQIKEIIEFCLDIIPNKGPKIIIEPQSRPITNLTYDISKAKRELKFTPQVDLKEGIKHFFGT